MLDLGEWVTVAIILGSLLVALVWVVRAYMRGFDASLEAGA